MVEAVEPFTIPIVLPGSTVASAVTAADGTYRLRIPGGSDGVFVRFGAAKATGGTSPTGYTDGCHGDNGCAVPLDGPVVAVPAGHTVARGVWKLAPAAVLKGRLVDSLGRGVGGFPVTLTNSRDCYPFDPEVISYGGAVTDVNGNYVAGRLQAVNAQVCFGDTPYVYSPRAGTPARDGYDTVVRAISFTAGTVINRNLTLTGRGAFSGTVVDQFGAPVQGATVSVSLPVANGPTASSNAAGVFRVGGVPSGDQSWCVEAPLHDTTCGTGTITQFRTTALGRIVIRRSS